jgi:DNA-binding SARP family transcriptional activator
MPALMLMGRPLLLDDAGILVIGRAAQRHCLALLALLAVERRGLSRERLVAYLWPDADEPTARHRLSVALHVIRVRLADGAIRSSGDALMLEPARWTVDLWSCDERLGLGDFVQARAMCSETLLDGFFLRGSPHFEQWLERSRERLTHRHLSMLDALAAAAEREGDLTACLDYREELVARDPCSSARTVSLMQTLAAAGRADGAIRLSRAYALRIREEFGLEPDAAVAACVASLLKANRQADSVVPAAAIGGI